MVYQPTQPGTINKKHKRSKTVQILLDALTLLLVAGATYAIFRLTAVKTDDEVSETAVVSKVPTDEEDEEDPAWAKKTILQWFTNYPRNFRAGVVLYDLDNDLAIGEVAADDAFTGQAASDLAARFGLGFATDGQTSAREMSEIMKAVYKHDGMDETSYATLKEGMLAQTDVYSEERCQGYCRTRYGIPAGFEVATVYNENYMRSNGSFFLAYRDAAILEFKTSDGRTRNFVLVLLAENFSDQAEFAKLGKALETAIIEHFDNEPLK